MADRKVALAAVAGVAVGAGGVILLRLIRSRLKAAVATAKDQRAAVASAYTAVATGSASCCVTPAGNASRVDMGYSDADRKLAGEAGADLGLGCGNPVELAELQPGEVVIDLGCGAGIDCLLATSRGCAKAIGVDMVPEMLTRAKAAAAKVGKTDVTDFRLGEIEHLPVADGVADAIISNCVLNLCADQLQVLREAWRVLKPGGRLAFSDVVQEKAIPDRLKNEAALACWVAGAPRPDDLAAALKAAGFVDVCVAKKEASKNFIKDWLPGSGAEDFVVSANVTALKPGGAARRAKEQEHGHGHAHEHEHKHDGCCGHDDGGALAEAAAHGHGHAEATAEAEASGWCPAPSKAAPAPVKEEMPARMKAMLAKKQAAAAAASSGGWQPKISFGDAKPKAPAPALAPGAAAYVESAGEEMPARMKAALAKQAAAKKCWN